MMEKVTEDWVRTLTELFTINRVFTRNLQAFFGCTKGTPRDSKSSVIEATERTLMTHTHTQVHAHVRLCQYRHKASWSAAAVLLYLGTLDSCEHIFLWNTHIFHNDLTSDGGTKRKLSFNDRGRETLHSSLEQETSVYVSHQHHHHHHQYWESRWLCLPNISSLIFPPNDKHIGYRGICDPESMPISNVR